MTKLSDYITNYLEGITDSIFLVSGGGVMHIVDSIGRSKLNSYCCHHEQGCSLAAEGYARQKNDIGVLAVTTGPGGTNAITGVAAAWTDNIPMMVISGQVRKEIRLTYEDKMRGLRQIGPQEINILDIVRPITKYAVSIDEPIGVKYHLEKATYLAKSGKPGPVWLDVPLDVQCAEINEKNLQSFEGFPKPHYNIPFDKITGLLNNAERPLMIVGNGVRLSGGVDELWKFIDKTKINVISAMSGDDLVTFDYPHYLGTHGITGRESANYAGDNCDLLLILGTRMQLRETSFNYKNFAKNAVKIMVDIDNEELLKKTLDISVRVCADAKLFLEGILAREDLKLKRWDVESKPITYTSNPNYIDVYEFFDKLSGKCDYPVITTNGMAAEATHQALRLRNGQRLITNTTYGEMGKGLPMAIGACVANSKKPVICMEGDGSIMMNVQEVQTLLYHKLPVKLFLFNNGGYYSIRNTHNKFFNKVFAADESSGLSLPDWSRLAPAWGINYDSIKSASDLSKLDKILNSPGSVFTELFIDPQQKMIGKWSA